MTTTPPRSTTGATTSTSVSQQQLLSGKMIICGRTPGRQTFVSPRTHLYNKAAAINPSNQPLTVFEDSEEDVRFVEAGYSFVLQTAHSTAALSAIPHSELVNKAKSLEDWAYRLGLEEKAEMQRGRELNVLGSQQG